MGRRRGSELGAAMAILGNLPSNTLIKFPTGTYGFVGMVDVRLKFIMADGSAPTEDAIATARQCGPGFVKGLQTRAWKTAAEAVAAATALGLTVDLRGFTEAIEAAPKS